MTIAPAKKGVLRRHPFLFGIAAAVIAAIVFLPKSPEHEYKKLDYTRSVLTDDLAIICPQSLLFDTRADHDANAILGAFTAFMHRDEKAKALGCDVVRGGIPVTAKRMDSPFDPYVAVSLSGVQGEFFTMESDLKNDAVQDDSSQTSGTPQPTADEIVKAEFEKRLSTLEKPMPNLRWLPLGAALNPRPDKQEDADLITPYGPCAMITGNFNRTGYSVTKFNSAGVLGDFLGDLDSSRASAKEAAQEYCHDWYVAEAKKPLTPAQIGQLWFKPDTEEQSGASADSTAATPTINAPPDTDSLSQTPAPIVRRTLPPAPAEVLTWHTESNGDEVLTGASSGKCATIALVSAHDPLNRLHVTFGDGSTALYSIEETSDAMQAATNYCRTGNRLVEGAH